MWTFYGAKLEHLENIKHGKMLQLYLKRVASAGMFLKGQQGS